MYLVIRNYRTCEPYTNNSNFYDVKDAYRYIDEMMDKKYRGVKGISADIYAPVKGHGKVLYKYTKEGIPSGGIPPLSDTRSLSIYPKNDIYSRQVIGQW